MDHLDNVQGLYSSKAAEFKRGCLTDFREFSRALDRCAGPVIGIFRDEAYSGRQTPSDLSPGIVAETWGTLGSTDIVFLDSRQIVSYEVFARSRIDVLVLPYGSAYPVSANPPLAGHHYDHFLRHGGALLTTGGLPFGRPHTRTFDDIAAVDPQCTSQTALYERWVAAMGVKYYRTPVTPPVQRWNRTYLPSVSSLDCAGSALGLVFNNSPRVPVPSPPCGNVFPERYPIKNAIPLLWGEDIAGEAMVTNAVLVQDYTTGGRIVSFSHEARPHPLSPDTPWFPGIMRDLLTHLTNRVMVKDTAAQYACYRQGEAVEIHSEIVSFERAPVLIGLHTTIRYRDRIVRQTKEELRIHPGETIRHHLRWAPGAFEYDEYEIAVTVKRDGFTVSHAENAFVVWSDAVSTREPRISIHGQFMHVGDDTFIAGTNYYESNRGELMWLNPDAKRIMSDLRRMRDCGVNYIRPHFHHLKWFADYMRYQHDELRGPYEQLRHTSGYMPDERVWRIWDLFIYACRKYGIIYGGDLFTLVPEEMGDPRGWYGPTDVFCSREKRAAQKEFLHALDTRYAKVPGIAWDLFNEPVGASNEMLAEWAGDLRGALSESEHERLITIGGPSDYFEGMDFLSPHGKPNEDFVNATGRPCLMQELHLDADEEHELEQAEQLRRLFVVAVRGGIAGLAPWSWTRQTRLWQSFATDNEKWDDRLGLHTHEDGTLKPAGLVFSDMAALFRSMRFERFEPAARRTYTARGEVIGSLREENGVALCSIYHIHDSDCFGAMDYRRISSAGRALVSSSGGGYVTAFSDPDGSIGDSKTLYVKCDRPSVLTVRSATRTPKAVSLCHLVRDNCRELRDVSWKTDEDHITIETEPTMERYWLRISY